MDLLFFVSISFILLLISAIKGYFIVAPLLASMAILIAILLRRGFPLKTLIQMAVIGSQKSFSVIAILLLIGAVMAVWMAAGTVPVLVYWQGKRILSITRGFSTITRLYCCLLRTVFPPVALLSIL